MTNYRRALAATLLLLATAIPAGAAYTVLLRDGSKIIAKVAPTVEGDKAIIVLQNGTRTSIDAVEIDVERTREANRGQLGGTMVIEDGRVTELTSGPEPPKRETLSDLIAKRQVGPGTRTAAPGSSRASRLGDDQAADPRLDYRAIPRRPFRDLEIAGEVQRFFRAQGVQEMLIYQGTQSRRILLDVVTNSEASVFRALEVAASCLEQIRTTHPGQIAAFELVFSTVERESGGQFVIDPDSATLLTGDVVETSAFFVDQVRF